MEEDKQASFPLVLGPLLYLAPGCIEAAQTKSPYLTF